VAPAGFARQQLAQCSGPATRLPGNAGDSAFHARLLNPGQLAVRINDYGELPAAKAARARRGEGFAGGWGGSGRNTWKADEQDRTAHAWGRRKLATS